MIYGTVLCLGDSITFGARSEYTRAYPEELAKLMTEHYDQNWSTINAGINGQTSVDILRRTFPTVGSFAGQPGAKIGCLMAGTNDSKNPDYPLDLYKDNMRQMINIFRRHDLRLLIGTLPPIKGDEMPCFFTRESNEWIQKANVVIRELADEYTLPLVDFSDMEEYLIDGVHLNYAGYLKMAHRWFKAIQEL